MRLSHREGDGAGSRRRCDKVGSRRTHSACPAQGMGSFATLPNPPYYVVCFSSRRTKTDAEGYGYMAKAMVELAAKQPGFLGIESARGSDGFGITNSYWRSEESIRRWKADVDHIAAQRAGAERWYEVYEVRIARVERAYGGKVPAKL